jgi:hypothetical protein
VRSLLIVGQVCTDAIDHHPNKGAIMRLVILGLMRENYPKDRKPMEHRLKILVADLAGVMQTIKSLCTVSVSNRYGSVHIEPTTGGGVGSVLARNFRGVGIKTIQKLMGHRHIGTTAAYCEVNEETLRNAVELV